MPSNDYLDIDHWSCPTCSFENSNTSYPTCQMCNQVASQFIEDTCIADFSGVIWQCHSCTRINNANNVICEFCYQTISAPEHDESDFINKTSLSLNTKSITTADYTNQSDSNLEMKFQQIISYCKEFQTHFIDDQFIPSNVSLGSNSFKNVSQWLRISDITPSSEKDYHLSWSIISSPKPSDIEQGFLGNCWLMAALALITERPRILQQILLTPTVNNEGIYLIRICHNGLWKTIIVDDCFPCTNQKQLVFSQAKRRQLYVPLIEKACAKLFGSYDSLKSGNMFESLQLLTGAPCDHIILQKSNTDIVWAKLISACESNLLIGASTGRTDVNAEEYSKVRIHSNHAFSILATHTLSNLRFVLVRDPHARSTYTDKHVTQTVLDQLRLINNTPRSSGAFWISWSIFLRFFASITISNYNENLFDKRYEGQFTRSSTQHIPTYRFSITKTSLINISLVYHRSDRRTRPYHTQSFVLCDINEESSLCGIGKYENILKSHQGGFTYWTGSLRPGNYVLIPYSVSFWGKNNFKSNDYTVVIQSSISIDVNITKQPPTFLADCLISAVVKKYHISTEEKNMTTYVTPNQIRSKLFIIENWSSSDYLNFDTNMIHSNNIQHSRCSSITHDCIPPYHRQLIFITEWIDDRHSSIYPTYNFTYEHTTYTTGSKPIVSSFLDDLHTPRLF